MKAKKIYVSGPYTSEPIIGTRHAVEAAERIFTAGHLPFIPHTMTILWHMIYPHTYNEWIIFDLNWLLSCDCLVRLPGRSKGSDIEVQFAEENNIPVFFSVTDCLKWLETDHSVEECSRTWRNIARS